MNTSPAKNFIGRIHGYCAYISNEVPNGNIRINIPSSRLSYVVLICEFLDHGMGAFPPVIIDKHSFFDASEETYKYYFSKWTSLDFAKDGASECLGSPEYLALLDEMADLHRRKNAGYSGQNADPWSNFRECQKFGVDAFTGVLVRMSDKWSRIQSLKANPANEQVGESIKDTLKDLAAYALIAIILYDEQSRE